MVNEINSDLSKLLISDEKPRQTKNDTTGASAPQEEVNTHLSSLAHAMLATTEVTTTDTAKIAELKSKIDGHTYSVDSDKLALQLYTQLFSQKSNR